jgi:enoyl-CoA hydratase/carnithine racemase
MLDALQAALDAIAADRSVAVVRIAAAGPVFCAGHDLRELAANPSPGFRADLFQRCARVMTTLVHLPQPVIAEVRGMATAAGCQLVASCDLVVAAENARFATPGVDIGLFCSTPMVALSRVVAPRHALEMLLTGQPIDAAEARRIGLVNRVVADADLETAAGALARLIAGKSRGAIAVGKRAFHRQREMPLDDAYAYTAAIMTRNMASADATEGIGAFLAKRPPIWPEP